MSFANPQSNGLSLSAAALTIATTLASPIAVGDLVVVDVGWGAASGTCTVADNLGNSYTPAGAAVPDATNGDSGRSFYTIATVAGTPTITATFGGASVGFRTIVAAHYTSTAGFAFDVASLVLKAASTTPTSSSVTASTNNSLVVGSCADTGGFAVPGAGAGMTLAKAIGDGSTTAGSASAWKTLATAGSVSANFTLSSAFASITGVMVFKPLGGAVLTDDDAGWLPRSMPADPIVSVW